MSIEVTSSRALNTFTSIECDEIKFSFKFIIKNFSKTKQELWSQSFNTGLNCVWMLYLSSNKSDGEKYVSAFLKLVASDRNSVLAKFRIGIINNNNEIKYVKYIDGHQFNVGEDWGWSSFVKRSIVLDNDNNLINITNQNTLTIICEIIIQKSIIESCEQNEHIMDCNLLRDFSNIFKDKELTDLKIILSNDKEFMVHKIVLYSRSKVFADLIREAEKVGQNFLIIRNIEEDIFEEVLKFIYTGKTYDKMNDKTEKLLEASNRFGINQLKRITEDIIYQNISYDTAIHVLLFADENDAIELKDKSLKFIACNHPFVKRASPEIWEEFIEEQSDLVMEIFDTMAVINHIH